MISDFGLSKIGPIDQTAYNVSVSVKGTFGYLDPEYFYTSKLTRKTDVYAFGVVLFELLSGKLAVDRHIEEEQGSLARWAQKCVKEKRFDQMVDSNITGTIAPKCLRGFAEIANRCLIRDFEKRPSMTQVVAKLQDLLELQEKCDNSADSRGTSGFTWMIRQGGTGFPKSNENHMNQGSSMNRDGGGIGKKPHEHGELIAGDIKVFTYAELKTAVRNFKNPAHLGSESKEKWWIDNTGYSPCMDDTGLPILVKIVDSHILSDLKKLKEFCHPNLVKVIGYCKGETNLLVSEFVHNGNFENLLRSGTIGLLPLATKDSSLWDWDISMGTFELNRYRIFLDEVLLVLFFCSHSKLERP
ncbi:kinase RLK-Pelle-CrRLK1L-1 family protein [Tanacetum coccineum]